MMKKSIPAANPDAYVTALSGWRRSYVEALRDAVKAAAAVEETIKWGHLVYFSNGPVLLIRAEDERVLFGFWRGQRLLEIEPRLKSGGKYEMATLELRDETPITFANARRLTEAAVALNKSLGDPTVAAPSKRSSRKPAKSKAGKATPTKRKAARKPARKPVKSRRVPKRRPATKKK